MANERIYGTEMEYGSIIINLKNGKYLTSVPGGIDQIRRRLHEITGRSNVAIAGHYPHHFTENGSRIYIDQEHVEYATPECLTPQDAIAAEIAGGRILQRGFKVCNAEFGLIFIKENVGFESKYAQTYTGEILWTQTDHNPAIDCSFFEYIFNPSERLVSYGYHENYSLDPELLVAVNNRDEYDSLWRDCLNKKIVPFLISRQAVVGSGTFIFGKPSFSARSQFITDILLNETLNRRPIINTRYEFHGIIPRLHLIIGEGNMSQISSILKLGTTGLVLRLMEDNLIDESFELKDIESAIDLIKEISFDISCKKKIIAMKDGSTLSSCDLQRKFYNLASEHYPKDDDPDYLKSSTEEILYWWSYVLDCLESEDQNSLIGILDWPTKFYLVRSLLDDLNISINDMPHAVMKNENMQKIADQIRAIEQRYHEISPEGLYESLRRKQIMKNVIPPGAIGNFMVVPPENTRAYGRGLLLGLVKRNNNRFMIKSADWSRVEIAERPDRHESWRSAEQFIMDNPFIPSTLKIDTFLRQNK